MDLIKEKTAKVKLAASVSERSGGSALLHCTTEPGLIDAWSDYVEGFAAWKSFWTLTFRDRDRTHDVTRSEAEFLWRRLVQVLNTSSFGNHYTRSVGHSYFGYALSFEYTTRGLLHMHALVDRRTDWELVNRIWRHMAGIAKIKPVTDSVKVSRYLCKYVSKGGDVLLYRPKKDVEPFIKRLWWFGL